jgi:hypothetical protein
MLSSFTVVTAFLSRPVAGLADDVQMSTAFALV